MAVIERNIFGLLLLCGTLGLSACDGRQQDAPPPATEVSVVEIKPEAVAVTDELPGRVVAYRVAQIRPQVGGIIQRRLFEQGSEVRAGQALFQIDPAPFRADVATARAALQHAQATLARAQVQAKRLEPLVSADAISRQAYDDAVAARDQAAADVAQNRAVLERRRIDLEFSTIRSPISGRIDQAVLTEGALVGVGDASPLATVQQIDHVYVDVRQPATRLAMLRALAQRGMTDQRAPVEILAGDGEVLPVHGRLLFSGISVDPGTGEVVARVEVANDDRALLPGMFVRARLPRETRPQALLVPLQAVQRDGSGAALVNVVDDGGAVFQRLVTTGAEIAGRLVVETGLRPGDKVIVEGQDRLQPGVTVKPMAWRAAGGGAAGQR